MVKKHYFSSKTNGKLHPLFKYYPIYGAKHLDFLDFCKGVYILKDKLHLTPEGLKALKDLAYAMNTYREY